MAYEMRRQYRTILVSLYTPDMRMGGEEGKSNRKKRGEGRFQLAESDCDA